MVYEPILQRYDERNHDEGNGEFHQGDSYPRRVVWWLRQISRKFQGVGPQSGIGEDSNFDPRTRVWATNATYWACWDAQHAWSSYLEQYGQWGSSATSCTSTPPSSYGSGYVPWILASQSGCTAHVISSEAGYPFHEESASACVGREHGSGEERVPDTTASPKHGHCCLLTAWLHGFEEQQWLSEDLSVRGMSHFQNLDVSRRERIVGCFLLWSIFWPARGSLFPRDCMANICK